MFNVGLREIITHSIIMIFYYANLKIPILGLPNPLFAPNAVYKNTLSSSQFLSIDC
jgi:hypothetical protein